MGVELIFGWMSGLEVFLSTNYLRFIACREAINAATSFKLGKLPVQYLGVPLVTTQLTVADCAPLLERISVRINSWSFKLLLYAGRIQLVQSVLFSIQNYWSRTFLLPKRILNQINQLCSRFLWHGDDKTAKGARVKWTSICIPKSEGGLGIKDLLSWNQANILRLIWTLVMQSGSLWIAWINTYVLKGRNFFQVQATSTCSWSWRKILKLRELALQFVNWKDGSASWKGDFKTAKVWEAIRPKQNKVHWNRLIWTSHVIPKHAVIAWMAVLNRLPTKDRLQQWGFNIEGHCLLCENSLETRDHIFLDCRYAEEIWTEVFLLCGLRKPSRNWDQALDWATTKFKGKALISLLLRVAWNATLYHLWQERNNRLHNGKATSPSQTMDRIKQDVRLRIARLHHVKSDSINMFLYSSWGLSHVIFS